jgi:hypothetical protein
MLGWRLGLLAVGLSLMTLSVLGVSTAVAAPNPFKALGELRQAWKESEGAQVALKLIRKTATKTLVDWRNSKGATCPWKYSTWGGFCANNSVKANGRIDFWIIGVKLGTVSPGTVMNAGCISHRDYVRVLWPLPGVPWYWVKAANLTGGTLPYC